MLFKGELDIALMANGIKVIWEESRNGVLIVDDQPWLDRAEWRYWLERPNFLRFCASIFL